LFSYRNTSGARSLGKNQNNDKNSVNLLNKNVRINFPNSREDSCV